jgi:hypothetical protein
MRHLGSISLLLTAAMLIGISLATGERGYCRMLHLVAKPVGLGAFAVWAYRWESRSDIAAWTFAARFAWAGVFVAALAIHAVGALAEAPEFCSRPACAEATGPNGWLDCLATRYRG